MNRLLAVFAVLLAAVDTKAGQPIDPLALRLPEAGDYALYVLAPTLLEATIVTAPPPGSPPVDLAGGLRPEDFRVERHGVVIPVEIIGAKRRVLYAPQGHRDLRVATSVYLRLPEPLRADPADHVRVTVRSTPAWPTATAMSANVAPLRYSPAIHVNPVGYVPRFPKSALVGYYLGTAGELPIPADVGFDLVDVHTGAAVFHGPLRLRRDVGFTTVPRPYQGVYEADFGSFERPGEYRVHVAGLGASLPFRIDEGAMMALTRTYALGLYHQRCGTANELPYTRFTHAACHVAPAEIPWPEGEFPKAWKIIADLEKDAVKPEHPELQLRHPRDQLYPFTRQGRIDVSGGHHDAGDYSRYLTNSATLVHVLIFAVDSLPGVAALDNLGLPESGDGIGDVLQEAKWESDFIARMQDQDGGFHFLVYPRDRRYENNVLPDHGDPQIVWPKNTAATAAAVAALAQCAGSPEFRKHYPNEARRYLEQARRGWAFLLRARQEHGRRAYQRLTHYGDAFEDRDELAWAAAELFVATGDRAYERTLREGYPDPADPATWLYQWRRAAFAYGNAQRSYAFAVRSGRRKRNELDAGFLAKCETELRRAGEAAVRASEQSAYGVSFPEASKRFGQAGWFFPNDEAFDITVAHQLQGRPRDEEAVLANAAYEAGRNPLNRSLLTGIGILRQREIVDQFANADHRVLPPSGIPLGSLQSNFHYMPPYKKELGELSWPPDGGNGPIYPLYDRWSDAYNLSTEFVVVNQGRALASLAYWAAQTALRDQPWKSAAAKIVGGPQTARLHQPLAFHLECPEVDLGAAQIVWEGRDQEPAYGRTYTFIPRSTGTQWVEAEAMLPDGRRVFARTEFRAEARVVFWVNGALPRGAKPWSEHGDTWTWIPPSTKPDELKAFAQVPQHESALADGIHEHGFSEAEATLEVEPGDILFAYVFIDPQHPPKTLMLEWNDGSNEHRAFWGTNHIPYGKMNTESQRPMGPLPPGGQWVRLEVPAKAVGLEGRTVTGMMFRLHSGRARWDAVGKISPKVK